MAVTPSATQQNKGDLSKPYMPVAGLTNDGYSNDEEATATCFCGGVQLAFPVNEPGLVGTFVCNCSDCHKITASMFASNFIVLDSHLKYLRGKDLLKKFENTKSIGSGHKMTNSFCSNCGTLMYRVGAGFPGRSIMRIGTVDDFHLAETKLKPQVEQYVEERPSWLGPVKGVKQAEGMAFKSDPSAKV